MDLSGLNIKIISDDRWPKAATRAAINGARPGEAQLIFKKAMDHLRGANSGTGARAQLCACESDPAIPGNFTAGLRISSPRTPPSKLSSKPSTHPSAAAAASAACELIQLSCCDRVGMILQVP
jgi:hypothetical protein